MKFHRTTFGIYKGHQMALYHSVENQENFPVMPYICKMFYDKTYLDRMYLTFLKREVPLNCKSIYLEIGIYGNLNKNETLQPILNNFKFKCRTILALRKLRQISRCLKFKEELIANVFHPYRINIYISKGLKLDSL